MRRFTLNLATKLADVEQVSQENALEKEIETIDIPVQNHGQGGAIQRVPTSVPVEEKIVSKPSVLNKNLIWAELLGFLPTDFIDKVVNLANSLIYTAIGEIEAFLSKSDPERADQIISQISTLFESSVDKHFDKFELYVLKNIFSLPKTLIVEDSIDLTDEESVYELDVEIEHLRKKILAKKYYQMRLEHNLKCMDERIAVNREMQPLISSILDKAPQCTGDGSVLHRLSSLRIQIEKLRDLKTISAGRIKDISFTNLVSRMDEKTNNIMFKISNYIQNSKRSDQENQLMNVGGQVKMSEYISHYNEAMKIGSLDDIQTIQSMLMDPMVV